MSGSAALEYGFPSTHSTNAASVAVYALFVLNFEETDISPAASLILQTIAYFYALSIIVGRVYCGMHGFLDVVTGSLLGSLLSFVQCIYGDAINNFIIHGAGRELVVVILIILVLVRIHPEPADDCPCFDDSVAFAGVMIGVEFGNWHFSKSSHSSLTPYPATIPFNLERMGWLVTITRIALGVVVIFAWRGTMKPTLLRILPPIFRVVESFGLTLPRRFFKQASEYKRVPKQDKDDNIIPHVSEIPHLLGNLRRRRAVSVGPQSEADVYETLAYREKKRRDSLSSLQNQSPPHSRAGSENSPPPKFRVTNGSPATEKWSEMFQNSHLDKPNAFTIKTGAPVPGLNIGPSSDGTDVYDVDDKDLFSNLQKPRVRYDVEVVTKLIVYSGIAWLAVEGNPILFHLVGLGL